MEKVKPQKLPESFTPKAVDPNKTIVKPPRIRAAATRNYGKGQPATVSDPDPLKGIGWNLRTGM